MDVVSQRLQLPKLSELCRKYGLVWLSASKQYFGFMSELEDLYGRKVDLIEQRGVRNPFFKASLEEQEVNVFAAK